MDVNTDILCQNGWINVSRRHIWIDQGILAVEMEISALMTVAIYRSIAMAGLLVVSDELFQLKWRPGFSNSLLKKSSRAAGKVLLRLAGFLK